MMINFFKKMVSNVIIAFSVFGLLTSGIVASQLVASADNVNNSGDTSLVPGTYVAPLHRNTTDSMNARTYKQPNQFSGRAILTVGEDNSQTLTIGIEHWSYYDQFAILNQEFTNDYIASGYTLSNFPEGFFNTENELTYSVNRSSEVDENGIQRYSYEVLKDSKEAKSVYEQKFTVATDVDEFFNFNVSVDYETGKASDIAYVSFPITDYSDRIYVYNWFNTPTSTSYNSRYLYNSSIIYLNTDGFEKIDLDNTTMKYATETVGFTTSTFMQQFKENTVVLNNFFDGEVSSIISNTGTSYNVKYYLAKNNAASNFQVQTENSVYYNLKLDNSETGQMYKLEKNGFDWADFYVNNYSDLKIEEDEKGKYISIEYNSEKELLIGRIVKFDINNSHYYCCLSVSNRSFGFGELSAVDTDNGVAFTVKLKNELIDQGFKLNIEKNSEKTDYGYTSSLYDTAYWYNLTFKIGDNVVKIPESVKLTINLPKDFNENDWYAEEKYYTGDVFSSSKLPANVSSFDYENNIWTINSVQPDSGLTFAILKFSDRADLESENLSDGIYSATINFNKTGLLGTSSMSNDALDHSAYIVRKDGINTLFFKSHELYKNDMAWYIGDLYCIDLGNRNLPLYSTMSYTGFMLDGDKLLDNASYDAVTEWGCLTGGILTLDSRCYNSDEHVYTLGICAPAMDAMGGASYKKAVELNNSGGSLTVWLVVTDLKPCDSGVTVNTIINNFGFGYKSSALLRKIKQAEVKFNIGENTVKSYDEFKNAKDVYANPNATSKDIENAINELDSLNLESVPSAAITGYSLDVNDDYSLNYFVDLGRDAQTDENAAVEFKFPNGTSKKVSVKDSEFVDGQGYKFTVNVAAKEMADKISANIVLSNETKEIENSEESVKDYLTNFISASSDEKKKELAQSILNYGAYAQTFFNHNTSDLAADLSNVSSVTADTVKDYANNFEIEADDLEFYGSALNLEDKTSVKLFFEITDEDEIVEITDYKFTVNGETVKAVKSVQQTKEGNDLYYITIPRISAGNLGKKYEFTVNDQQLWYSPYTYVYNVLTNSDDTNLQNLVKALYIYGETAANAQ